MQRRADQAKDRLGNLRSKTLGKTSIGQTGF